MRCPEDKTELELRDGVHVCSACSGKFVDASHLSPEVAARLEMETRTDSGAFERIVMCPDCGTAMAPWRFERMQSWIERCPRCHYFWLDKRDQQNLARIEKTVARQSKLTDEQQQAVARAYVESSDRPQEIAPMHAILAWLGFPVLTRIDRSRTPWATWTLAAIVTVLFLAGFEGPYRASTGTVWDAFTATFTHFGWLHLIGNAYFLLVFGDGVEQRLPRPLLVLGFVVFGTLSILIDGLFENSWVQIAGSSGAIAVMMGAAIMLQPRARVTTRLALAVINVPILVYGAIELGYQILMWMLDVDGTAWVAHIAGIAFGLLLGKLVAYFTVPREARVL